MGNDFKPASQLQMLSIDDITQSLLPVFQKYDIQKSILFGSFAKADVTKRSDVDLLVVKETKERFLTATKEYIKIFVQL